MTRIDRACVFALALILPGGAHADSTQPIFEFVERGLLCPTRVVGEQEAPDTISGILRLIDADQPLALITSIVPMRIGAEFGVRSRLKPGSDPIAAEVVVTHPPMPPTMERVERWTTTLRSDSTSIIAFTFERPEELLPGRWQFALRADGVTLMDRSFDVSPDLDLAYQTLCEGPDIIS